MAKRGDPVQDPQDLTNVFTFIDNLDIGLKRAKTESKPLMLIVHSSYCRACKSLRPKLIESNDVKIMGKEFFVVNALDGKEPKAKNYGPDGFYYPRFEDFIFECFNNL